MREKKVRRDDAVIAVQHRLFLVVGAVEMMRRLAVDQIAVLAILVF